MILSAKVKKKYDYPLKRKLYFYQKIHFSIKIDDVIMTSPKNLEMDISKRYIRWYIYFVYLDERVKR